MAYQRNNVPTLHDLAVASSSGKMDAVLDIVEMMSEERALIEDMAFVEGNQPTGHTFRIRTKLPPTTWRRYNMGVPPTKSESVQVTETCGMMEAVSEVDEGLLKLQKDPAKFRLQEASAHIESMMQEFSYNMWYGNTGVNPEKIVGFSTRYSSLTAGNGRNILDGGDATSSPNQNTSIWLLVWSERTMYGITSQGTPAGLRHIPGKEPIDLVDKHGGTFRGYRDRFQWNVGSVLEDWRYGCRIANLDYERLNTSGTASSTAADLMVLMLKAITTVQSVHKGRPVFYCNRNTFSMIQQQLYGKAHFTTVLDLTTGLPRSSFMGIPIRMDDSLLNTEEKVV